jgi:hypothetical protein
MGHHVDDTDTDVLGDMLIGEKEFLFDCAGK